NAAGEGGLLGPDFVAGAGEHVPPAGGDAVHVDDDGLARVAAEAVQGGVHLVGVGDGAAGGIDLDDDGLHVAVVGGAVEVGGELLLDVVEDHAPDAYDGDGLRG